MASSGGWNRGLRLPVKYLVVSEKALEQLQPRELTGLKEAVQLCRELTLERRGIHVVIKVVKTLCLDDVVIKPKTRDRDKYPWKQLAVNASFVYQGTYASAMAACAAARVRLKGKRFKAFLVDCGDTFDRKVRVEVRRMA
jgi:hypothetical protein